MRRISLLIFIGLLVGSCKSKSQNHPPTIKQFKGFVTCSVPNAGYVISIPADYKITESNGPDFSVYYIHRKDSTIKGGFSATMYLGNAPSLFSTDKGCKPAHSTSTVLDDYAQWDVYGCNNRFFVQTIVKNKKNNGWDSMVHAAGRAKSKAGIDTVLYIFSTLKAEPNK